MQDQEKSLRLHMAGGGMAWLRRGFRRGIYAGAGAIVVAMLVATPAFAKDVPLDARRASPEVATRRALAQAAGTQAAPVQAVGAGVVIIATDAAGPAAQAGIVRGDILLQVGDVAIDSAASLFTAVTAAAPGDEVVLVVQHGDDMREFTVTLGQIDDRAYLGVQVADAPETGGIVVAQPSAAAPAEATAVVTAAVTNTATSVAEVSAVEATADNVVFVGLGLAVAEVMADSPAAQAGVVAGDMIVALDGQRLTTLDQLVAMLAAYAPGDAITLTVQRGGPTEMTVLEVPVTLGASPDDPARAYLGIRAETLPSTVTVPAVPAVRAYTAPAVPGIAPGYAYPPAPNTGAACGTGGVIIQQYFYAPGYGMDGALPAVPVPSPYVPPVSVPQSFAAPVSPAQPVLIYQADVNAAAGMASSAANDVLFFHQAVPATVSASVPNASGPNVVIMRQEAAPAGAVPTWTAPTWSMAQPGAVQSETVTTQAGAMRYFTVTTAPAGAMLQAVPQAGSVTISAPAVTAPLVSEVEVHAAPPVVPAVDAESWY